jgi:hypothetical protein
VTRRPKDGGGAKAPPYMAVGIVAVLVMGSVGSAQIVSATKEVVPDGRTRFVLTFSGPPHGLLPRVRNYPYTSEQITETTQTLADGTHVLLKSVPGVISRDAEGRRRLESRVLTDQIDGGITLVELRDWVAGYEYTLDTENHVAHRMKLPGPQTKGSDAVAIEARSPQPVTGGSASAGPAPLKEDLGEKVIDGVRAKGVRTTTTVPAGLRGNDRAVTIVHESWTAPNIEPPVLVTTRDPFSGDTVRKMLNFRAGEQDPKLFQVPDGYDVVDESGRFEIEIFRRLK